MSKRTPRPRRKPKPRSPDARRSPWNYLAPAALLLAVTAITLILSSAGVLGHNSDGNPPASSASEGPVETLSVPQTAPPPEPPPPQPQPVPPEPPPPPATTTKTTASTTSTTTTTTTATTTTDTTPETTTTEKTGSPGQQVKWTVKPGDTLGTIATQFGTTVKELIELNPDIDPDALQIGQEIVVG
jgi:LysM repeat protein